MSRADRAGGGAPQAPGGDSWIKDLRALYYKHFGDHKKERQLFSTGAFFVTFASVRAITHAIRAERGPFKNLTAGGRHIHHMTFGIAGLLTVGYLWLLEIGTNDQRSASRLTSIGFGSGAALTLDEFALWTRMEDVYWSEEGRSSLEAVAIVAVVGLLVVIGVRPFDLDAPASAVTVSAAIGLSLLVSVVAFLKGRILLGAVGLFILPVGLLGAIRVAHPRSPWARRRYPAGSRRRVLAEARFDDPTRTGARLRGRLADLLGGRPSEPDRATEA